MPIPPQETPSTDDDDDFSDSDADTAAEHGDSYHPISLHSDSDPESEPEPEPFHSPSSGHPNPNPNTNFFSVGLNGRINGGEHEQDDDSSSEPAEQEGEGEGEGEEGIEREASMLRVAEEDESRRSPLAPETASRIMDMMRGVNFLGSAPDWAVRVPEDRWVDQLRSLRANETAPGEARE